MGDVKSIRLGVPYGQLPTLTEDGYAALQLPQNRHLRHG